MCELTVAIGFTVFPQSVVVVFVRVYVQSYLFKEIEEEVAVVVCSILEI